MLAEAEWRAFLSEQPLGSDIKAASSVLEEMEGAIAAGVANRPALYGRIRGPCLAPNSVTGSSESSEGNSVSSAWLMGQVEGQARLNSVGSYGGSAPPSSRPFNCASGCR